MNTFKPMIILSAAALVATSGVALAKYPRSRLAAHRHANVRHVSYYYGPRLESSQPYYRFSQQPAPLPYVPSAYDYAPGSIIARATIRSQLAPGVATELYPDAAQTATGGPVGGFPSQSGGGR